MSVLEPAVSWSALSNTDARDLRSESGRSFDDTRGAGGSTDVGCTSVSKRWLARGADAFAIDCRECAVTVDPAPN